MKRIEVVGIAIIFIAITFGLSTLLFAGICWAFELSLFSLKHAFGFWLLCISFGGVDFKLMHRD